jgi:[ribosomal protein S5]-alanine N-acetyltransferase
MTTYMTNELVNLRGMRREDLEAYRSWVDNADVTRYMEMGWKPFSDADLEKTFEEATQAHDTVCMVIEEKSSGRAVGTTGLYLINWPGRRTQFRILIGEPSVFNKGLGTTATKLIVQYGFERLNMEMIYLGVNEENAGAVRAYEKAGFVRAGVQRNFVYNNGRYYNSVMMDIVREDYFSS